MLDFLSLSPDQLVESIVIDFYFSMLNFREISLHGNGVQKKKSFFYNSNLYNLLVSRTGNEIELSKSKSLLGNYLLDYSLLFFPVYISQHWLLCQIELKENNIKVSTFDSKTSLKVDQTNVQKLIGKWIKDELKLLFPQYNNIQPKYETAESIQQDKSNNYDCGAIVIFNALFLTEDIFYLIKKNLKPKAMKEEIIRNARYKIAIDIEKGFIQDYRIQTFFKIECFPFKNTNNILVKKPNKKLAELCSFVEGSKENPFDLLLEEKNEDFSDLLKQEKQQSDKWRFQYYKTQITLISVFLPFNAVLENFYEIESTNLQSELLNQLSDMVKSKDKDLIEVVQNSNVSINDNKRFSYHVDNESIEKLPKSFKKFLTKINNAIIAVTKNCINNVKRPDITILYSKDGCVQQQTHTDYGTETDNEKELGKKSYFAIFAIMDNTSVIVYDAEKDDNIKISIPKGGLFLARGDVIHAGSDYEKENIRLHVYLDNVDLKINNKDRSTFFDFQEE
jgi:succinate dehydrogenase flavin-adding protein (antitoxin of CptAB toxin-antitoxin module)